MSGYLDQVEIEGSNEEDVKAVRETSHAFLTGGILVFGVLFLVDLVVWLTERGGIFSIASALTTVHSKPPIINIDKSGLLLPFILLCWITAFAICRAFHLQFDLGSRSKMMIPILVIVGGGFILNGLLGEPIISTYMAHEGYSRCIPGDWMQGSGKSRVSFADYALTTSNCHSRGSINS